MANVLDFAVGFPSAPPFPSRAPGPPVRGRTSWTVQELLATDFPEPPWVVPDLLPVGLGILAGRPKIGKSWLALQLAIAIGSGGRFLDIPVDKAPVLYLALEDSPRRLKSRLELMQAPVDADIRFETQWIPLNGEAGGLGDLQRHLSDSGAALVVVDTLTRAFNGKQDWNDAASVTAWLGVLQQEAFRQNASVLLVHHHRKQSPMNRDTVSDIMGSTAISAVADVIWGLYKERSHKGYTLSVTGRDLDEKDLALSRDRETFAWQVLGEAEEVRQSELQLAVMDALDALGGEASTTEIASFLDANKGTVAHALRDLVAEGYVERGEPRGRTVPYRLKTTRQRVEKG